MSKNIYRIDAAQKILEILQEHGQEASLQHILVIIDRIYVHLLKTENIHVYRDFNNIFIKLAQLAPHVFQRIVRKEIKGGEGISISEFINKSDMDLVPNGFEKELREIEIRENITIEGDPVDHKCIFCGHGRALYKSVIIGAGDESECSMYTCCNDSCRRTHRTGVKD
jgi:DNA-directed RNA polymerase subunit M/transcription elongation factor TFIIS